MSDNKNGKLRHNTNKRQWDVKWPAKEVGVRLGRNRPSCSRAASSKVKTGSPEHRPSDCFFKKKNVSN